MSGLYELVLIGLLVAMTEVVEVLEGTRRWALVCADNEVVLPLLGDGAVGVVVADPPFEGEAHTLQRRIKSKNAPGSTDADLGRGVVVAPLPFPPITEEERRLSGAHFARLAVRWILAFCQVEAAPKWSAAIVAGGGRYVRTGVWIKPNAQPQLSGDRPGMGYESLSICHSSTEHCRWNGGGRVAVWVHPVEQARAGTDRTHPTEKPIALMLELVGLFSDEDEVVLDPFAGSGTTGVACLRLGRRFIGIERDEKYAAVARERLEAESQGLSLRAARAGQLPLLGAL